MALHNRVSSVELKKRLAAEAFRRITISFYQYAHIDDPQAFRNNFYQHLFALDIFGRIYIASEGINAQISVPEHHLGAFREYLNTVDFLKNTRLNIAVEDDGKSFWVLRIKVKDKIVADGISDPSFDVTRKGQYLDATTFNALTDDPSTVVVDMRNHYEYEVGHFENAIEIPSDTFREQLPMAAEVLKDRRDNNIIMYCTGGIRCEKASAYLLHKGFRNVFHLEGGIIQYAHKTKELGLKNKFLGKNFVFDERLGEKVGEGIISHCHQCGKPCDMHTNCKNDGCHLLFIQCDECAKKYEGCCSVECMQVVALPSQEQEKLRKGTDRGQMIFNKSRQRLKEL